VTKKEEGGVTVLPARGVVSVFSNSFSGHMKARAFRAGSPNFPNLTHTGYGEFFCRGHKYA
jgi:hypothetical protein